VVCRWSAYLKEVCHQVYVVVFLIQKAPLPEHMIGADAAFFPEEHFKLQSDTSGALTNEALQEYKRCFCMRCFGLQSSAKRPAASPTAI
jgi:hypothetical protein